MSDGFSFPALPKPKPLQSAPRPLPATNPLLAGATVTDRTAAVQGATAQGPQPAGVPPGPQTSSAAAPVAAAAAAAEPGGEGESGSMGGALGKPVVLTRHQRIAPARRKVPFEKGFSQMDWVRLTQTHPDLAGLGGQRPRRNIPMEEVALHCTPDDCWTVLRGKVYNITHYLRFHPGGVPLLLKVGGKDGTALFNKYHAWVNYEFLLAKCLVGLLAPPSSSGGSGSAAPGSGEGGTAGANGSSNGGSSGGAGAAGQVQQAAAGGAASSAAQSDSEADPAEHSRDQEEEEQLAAAGGANGALKSAM